MYVDKLMETTTVIAQHIEFTRLYQNLGVIPPSWQNVQTVFLQACTHVELHQVQIRSDLESIEIFADPLLERVFFNQIDNTMRYGGPKKTCISLAAHETSEGLVIAIEDDGIGIPPQDKEKIFRRGFGKNTGLGLFLAREILSITGIRSLRNRRVPAGSTIRTRLYQKVHTGMHYRPFTMENTGRNLMVFSAEILHDFTE